jgi:peptidyl-prolyl cis-trans isomerase A (cyclophilin A)
MCTIAGCYFAPAIINRVIPMSVKPISIVFVATLLLAVTAALPTTANATIVRVETVVGDFDINLYDNATPATVTNFLDYVQIGDFSDSIFHRTVANFIVQSGGFRTDLNAEITSIPTNPAVTNEPVYSNVRGTIAMAKLGNDPNSATSQWFINLANNAADLDGQNGGFTAFGEVTGTGMDVIDALAALPTYAFASPFGEIPLQNYSATDFSNGVAVDNTHLIIVTAITVVDSTVDSAGAAGLNPTPTTAGGTTPPPPADGGGGGGGSLGLLALLGLILVNRKRFL